MLVLDWRPLRWRSNKKVHLRPSASFFGDLERDRDGVAKRDGRQARQHVGMLRLLPVRRELIRRADEDDAVGHRQCLSWLEPGFVGLLRQLLSSAVEQPGPSFVGGQRHDGRARKTEAGGAKLESECGKRNCVTGYSQSSIGRTKRSASNDDRS